MENSPKIGMLGLNKEGRKVVGHLVMLSYDRCIQSESSGTACHIPVCQLSVIIHASGKMH